MTHLAEHYCCKTIWGSIRKKNGWSCPRGGTLSRAVSIYPAITGGPKWLQLMGWPREGDKAHIWPSFLRERTWLVDPFLWTELSSPTVIQEGLWEVLLLLVRSCLVDFLGRPALLFEGKQRRSGCWERVWIAKNWESCRQGMDRQLWVPLTRFPSTAIIGFAQYFFLCLWWVVPLTA